VAANTALPQEAEESQAAGQAEMAEMTTIAADVKEPQQNATNDERNHVAVVKKNATAIAQQQSTNTTDKNQTANSTNKTQQNTTGTGNTDIAQNATKNNNQDPVASSGSSINPGTVAPEKAATGKAGQSTRSTKQPDVEASLPYLASNAGGQQKTTNTRNGLAAQNAGGNNNTNTDRNEPVASNKKEPGNTPKNNNSTGAGHEEKEVPYQKIEIQERETKNGVVKKDTIFNGEDVMKVRVPKDQEVLALNKKDDNNSGSNMNPAAAAPASNKEVSNENTGMQKLGDHKVAAKKMKNYNPHRFEEMVRNAKFRMGAMKFYPGIVGGINGTVNGNLGVHAGLAANLSVSDRWSILAEVKYAHRFNFAKEKMQDDFITNVKFANVNGQGLYTYDSMEHYYNFGSYAALEVPLLVTYSKDRWIYMLGGNFRYNFKISNIQEVEQRYLLEQSLTSTTEPKFATQKQILLSDFTPSMNIAPMLGVGYQALPGLRLDLRVSKSVWNNSTTFGQKEISKSLHNIPQVQFNITHRFRSAKPYKRAQ
ncbi:MAG TPA: hypothetical protein VIN07_14610, partial [Flavipsychrobacter sp.]